MRLVENLSFAALSLATLLLLAACGDETKPGTNTGKTPSNEPAPETDGDAQSEPAATGLKTPNGVDPKTATRLTEAMAKGRAYLLSKQDEGGGWGIPAMKMPPDVGITAMATMGVIAATDKIASKSDPKILTALRFIASKQDKNGAIFNHPQYVNYHTSAAVGAFGIARIPEFAKVQTTARNYLASSQIRVNEADPSYGGFPYKQESTGQPADLSNGQMALQALHDANLPKDHEAWKAARKYLGRVQSNSETNDLVREVEVDGEKRTVVSGNDGGAFYGPDQDKAGMVKRSDGKWEIKSYGSMSYALLKCLIFAGVDPMDRRVQLVVKWISDHFTVDRNPGFEGADDPETAGQQGFYYYLYTAARALAEYEDATGKPLTIRDANGRMHNWREEMVTKLISAQQSDGSWMNKTDRWMEAVPVLATSYAMQCLGFITGRIP